MWGTGRRTKEEQKVDWGIGSEESHIWVGREGLLLFTLALIAVFFPLSTMTVKAKAVRSG